jgi:oxaloacetate decarboxylase alpha subunit
VITCRPADLIPSQLITEREKIKEFIEEEEDVLSYILFPPVALDYFKYRQAQKYKIDSDLVNNEEKTHPV